MKVFITGGEGQIAYDLKKQAAEEGYDIDAPSRKECSIVDEKTVNQLIATYQPDVVINTAAYTKVDLAEEKQEEALLVNAEGAKWLAIACQNNKIPLIHLSTDYVFDGRKKTSYIETDTVSPINHYGYTKLLGEQYVKQYCEQAIILRVSAVFGVHGHNFVKTILRLVNERDEISVVADQFTCPTPASAIADAIHTILKNPRFGIYHYCGLPRISWYDFACTIIEWVDKKNKIRMIPIKTEEYITLAKRGQNSVLNCEKIKKDYGIHQPDWKKGLYDVIRHLSTT